MKTFFTPSVIRCDIIKKHNGVSVRRMIIEESVYNVYVYICYIFFIQLVSIRNCCVLL